MGLEAVFFIGAFILLAALIYGVLRNHYRSRTERHVADSIVRKRYKNNET
ncbi:hypothetical protein I3J27_26560 [Bradyrhizobium xenonodulans]|uniref:Uncharacterized protein n=1 Tax=Bradyrhizobium xenonodulans TaxID=2736875 RepID=A0ABY7MGS8_9BRAD|nr:hypothetical protein [Bradyrhizobium xenonodulans]WBL76572.1 hypothetical protein I3J27_26560 [Bradyrhizobium xenonodulans]